MKRKKYAIDRQNRIFAGITALAALPTLGVLLFALFCMPKYDGVLEKGRTGETQSVLILDMDEGSQNPESVTAEAFSGDGEGQTASQAAALAAGDSGEKASEEAEQKESLLAAETGRETEVSLVAEESGQAAESGGGSEESLLAAEASQAAEESRLAAEASQAAEESRLAAEASQAAEESRLAAEASRAAEESLLVAEAGEQETLKETAAVTASGKSAGSSVSKSEVSAVGVSAWFTSSSVNDGIFSRMQGKSFRADCTTNRGDLRYLRVLHYDLSGTIRVGELVCHKDIASSLLAIFQELYNHKYPIQSMRLVDDFGGDDLASAAANNTSCFNFRVTAGTGSSLSRHATGKAIDINPLYNPYVWYDEEGTQHCDPENGSAYVDRSGSFSYKMTADDLCVQLFKQYGFSWGGDYRYEKDYMHFSIR